MQIPESFITVLFINPSIKLGFFWGCVWASGCKSIFPFLAICIQGCSSMSNLMNAFLVLPALGLKESRKMHLI